MLHRCGRRLVRPRRLLSTGSAPANHVDLDRLVRQHFPSMDFAMAYGSGVFVQKSYDLDDATAADAAAAGSARCGGVAATAATDMTCDEAAQAVAANPQIATAAPTPTPAPTSAAAAKDAPMIDLVFAVPDSAAWHSENLARNPSHYSLLARAAPRGAVPALQERSGAHIYYNTLVPIPGEYIHGHGGGGGGSGREQRDDEDSGDAGDAGDGSGNGNGTEGNAASYLMKYGVISTTHLCEDLVDWRTLYVSGRMHKPVRVLLGMPADLAAATQTNLQHALKVALLLLPGTFTERDLFMVRGRVGGGGGGGEWRGGKCVRVLLCVCVCECYCMCVCARTQLRVAHCGRGRGRHMYCERMCGVGVWCMCTHYPIRTWRGVACGGVWLSQQYVSHTSHIRLTLL